MYSETCVSANEEIRAVEIHYWWHVILSKTADELFYITVFGKFYISAKLPVQHVRQFVQTPVYVLCVRYYMYVQNFHSLYFSTKLPSVSNVTLCMRCTITVKGWNNSSLHDFKVLIHILKRNHVKVGKSVRKVRKGKIKKNDDVLYTQVAALTQTILTQRATSSINLLFLFSSLHSIYGALLVSLLFLEDM